jgi:hypothetical protein
METVMITEVKLTHDEILVLDGKCSLETQKIVDSIKEERLLASEGLTPEQSRILNKILTYARTHGEVDFQWRNISGYQRCPICNKRAGYATFKTGKNKGHENTKKPLYIYGAKFGPEFICYACHDVMKPIIRRHLDNIKCELHRELMLEGAIPMVKSEAYKCNKCGWTGYEHQIGKMPCLMGGGYYPGKCPGCGATQMPLSFQNVFTRDYTSWVIVPRSEHKVKSANDNVR